MPTPKTTDELLEQSKAMLEQTKSEGSKPFEGSSYDKPKPVSVLSSDAGSKIIQQDLKTLAEASQPKKAPTIPLMEPIKTTNPTKIEPQEPPTGGLSVEELQSAGINDPVSAGMTFDPKTNQYYIDPNSQHAPQINAFNQYKTSVDTTNKNLDGELTWVSNQMKSILMGADEDLAQSLSQITADYNNRKTQLEDLNRRALGQLSTALTRGGTARYLPTLKTTLMASEERAGLQKLSELAVEAQGLLLDAKTSAKTKKWDRLDEYMTKLQYNKEKQAEAAKDLYEKQAAFAKEIADSEMKASRDGSIADLYSSGTTSVSEILRELRKNGDTTTTLQDVADSIKDMVPTGLDDLVKTLRGNGAPQDVIQKVLSSPTINDAYKNAGPYVSGGTGIVGEYNYYKAQAEAAGQVPVDFNTYQDLDANRKTKIASAGGSGGASVTTGAPTSYKEWELAGKPGTYIDYLAASNIKAPTVAQQTVAEYAARIEQATPLITAVQDDIQSMNFASFMTQVALPPTFQSATIQQYMQAARNFINAKLRRESGAVISPIEFAEARKQYLPQPGDTAAVLQQKADNRRLVYQSLRNAAGNAYQSVDELMGTTSSELLKKGETDPLHLNPLIQPTSNNPLGI